MFTRRQHIWGVIGVGIILVMTLGVFTMASSSDVTEVVFWDFINPKDETPRGIRLRKQLDIFHKRYPNIRVNVQVKSPSWIDPGLIAAAKARSSPDVARVYNYFLPMHVDAGSIASLEKFTKDMDKNDWLVPWEATVFDGKKMGFPQEHRVFLFYYRKDLLEKVGGEIPRTWEEVGELGSKLNTPEVIGYAFGLSEKNMAYHLLEWFDAMMAIGRGDIFDEKGYGVFDNQAGLKFFQLIKDLVFKYRAAPSTVVGLKYDDIDYGLRAGTIATGCLATHRWKGIKQIAGEENFGWAPIPTYDGSPAPLIINGWHLVMGKHAKHPEEAWRFMEFLLTPEMQLLQAQQAAELPVRASTYQNAWFDTKEAKVMKEWAMMIEKYSIPAGYWTAEWFDLGQILAKETQTMILKDKAPKDALSDAQEDFKKLIKEKRG